VSAGLEAPGVALRRSGSPGATALAGRALRALLPLVKLRTQLRGISLGVRVRVADPAGRILLIRHSYISGWHFPGGGVEFGEAAADAARRELAEEAGVALLEPPALVGLFRNPEWTRGDHVAFFEAGDWAPCAAAWGVEIVGADFFAPDALPETAHPSVRRRLAEAAGAARAATW
jgi:ADP-ribose pyrophosphatase YjhB (NUDIX family)